MKNILKYAIVTFWLLLSQNALAQEAVVDSRWSISLAVGAGIRTNPVINNKDIPIILIPHISYQGERFFIQNLDIGYNLYDTQSQQLNILITPSYDQVFFNRWDANNFFSETQGLKNSSSNYPTVDFTAKNTSIQKIHKRRMAALAGLEYIFSYDKFDIQLQGLHEVTQYYSGDEIRFAISKSISTGANDIKLTVGANWQNQKTLDYFYGVTDQEAILESPYKPAEGVTTLLRVDWNYKINTSWDLRLFSSYRHLSEPIVKSPLIVKDSVITAFIGGVYHF